MIKIYIKYHLMFMTLFILISIAGKTDLESILISLTGYILSVLWTYLIYKDIQRGKIK